MLCSAMVRLLRNTSFRQTEHLDAADTAPTRSRSSDIDTDLAQYLTAANPRSAAHAADPGYR